MPHLGDENFVCLIGEVSTWRILVEPVSGLPLFSTSSCWTQTPLGSFCCSGDSLVLNQGIRAAYTLHTSTSLTPLDPIVRLTDCASRKPRTI